MRAIWSRPKFLWRKRIIYSGPVGSPLSPRAKHEARVAGCEMDQQEVDAQ